MGPGQGYRLIYGGPHRTEMRHEVKEPGFELWQNVFPASGKPWRQNERSGRVCYRRERSVEA